MNSNVRVNDELLPRNSRRPLEIKEALEKQIQDAVHKNQSSFKEWWLKPIKLEVCKWAIIGIFAFIVSFCWTYIPGIFSK